MRPSRVTSHMALQAIMKSYASTSADSENGFLAYMVPSIDEVKFSENWGLKSLLSNTNMQTRLSYHPFLVLVTDREGYIWWKRRYLLFLGPRVSLWCTFPRSFFVFFLKKLILPTYFCSWDCKSSLCPFNYLIGARWWCGGSHNVSRIIWWWWSQILGLFLFSIVLGNFPIPYPFLADSFLLQPLPKKLVLRKKRAREGKSTEEVEQFAVPRSVAVRRRTEVAVNILTEEEVRKLLLFTVHLHSAGSHTLTLIRIMPHQRVAYTREVEVVEVDCVGWVKTWKPIISVQRMICLNSFSWS